MPSKESQRGKNMCSLPHVWKLLDWSTGWRLPEARVGWAHEECWERGLQRISLQLEIWLQVLKQFHWTAIICHREIVCKRRVSRCGRLYHLSYFKKLPQPLQLSTATTLISQPPAAWRWDPPPAVTLRRHSLSTKFMSYSESCVTIHWSSRHPHQKWIPSRETAVCSSIRSSSSSARAYPEIVPLWLHLQAPLVVSLLMDLLSCLQFLPLWSLEPFKDIHGGWNQLLPDSC